MINGLVCVTVYSMYSFLLLSLLAQANMCTFAYVISDCVMGQAIMLKASLPKYLGITTYVVLNG